MLTRRRLLAMRLLGGGGAAAPLELPYVESATLQFYIEPDVGVYQDAAATTVATSDDDPIGYILDQAGSYHPTQDTEDKKPTLQTNIVNARPVMRFDGSNDYLALTNGNLLTIDNTCTVFVVHRTAAATRQTLIGNLNTAGAFQLELLDAANTRSAAINGTYIARVTALASDQWEVYGYRRDGAGATSMIMLDRQPINLATNSATGFTGNGTKEIGRRTATTQKYNGDIACILIYDDALTEADWWSVSGWLCDRYGITPQGPATDADLTVVYVPDLQLMTGTYPDTLTSMMQWIVDHQETFSINMVLFEGDIVEDDTASAEWDRIDGAIGLLDAAGIPYLICVGNHDYTNMSARDITAYTAKFPQSRFTSQPGWSGGFYSETTASNAYTIATINGHDYLFLALEFGASKAVLDWAGTVIAANPDADVFIVTHSYVYSDSTLVGAGDDYNVHTYSIDYPDACDGDEMWTYLVKLYGNIRCVGSGHDISGHTGNLQGTGDNGNYVLQFLANWQAEQITKMRIVQVDRAANTIASYTVLPDRVSTVDRYAYNINADHQFSYDYEAT